MSSDPGADTILSWTITWGDGEVQTVAGNPATVPHVYADNGIYAITAQATDEDGTYDADNPLNVTVTNVAPGLTALHATPTINENGVVTLTGTFTDQGTLDAFTLIVDWGEGAVETVELAANVRGFELTHRYLDDDPSGTLADSYAISVSLTDKDGAMRGVPPAPASAT